MPGTHQFCTLFDRRYLARAVALYRSLERCNSDFVLRAVCMDSDSRHLIDRLSLPRLRAISIEEVERSDKQLLAVRPSRTHSEYCWTSTPAVCRHFLNAEPELEMLTYLDADLYFSSSPEPLFAELGAGSTLLISHRSSAELQDLAGIYNVGWLTFRNDARGRAALEWWRERCLEWCHDRLEPGRYGDQKYLDDWPLRFEGVRVSGQGAAGLAPWNEGHHVLVAGGDGAPPLVDGAPLIYFHHAGLRAYKPTRIARRLAGWTGMVRVATGLVDVGFVLPNEPSSAVVAVIWREYLEALTRALADLAAVGAPDGLFLDRPTLRLTGRQIARRQLPAVFVDTYRRLPSTARHSIWRWFATS